MRGADREGGRDIVEAPVRGLVSRQEVAYIHVDREQVADRVVVLRAVQAVDRTDPSRMRSLRPRRVERTLEPARDRIVGGPIGARHSARRHRAGTELGDHLLPRRRVRVRSRGIQRVEGEARRAHGLVVADDAVPVEHDPDVRGVLADRPVNGGSGGKACLRSGGIRKRAVRRTRTPRAPEDGGGGDHARDECRNRGAAGP